MDKPSAKALLSSLNLLETTLPGDLQLALSEFEAAINRDVDDLLASGRTRESLAEDLAQMTVYVTGYRALTMVLCEALAAVAPAAESAVHQIRGVGRAVDARKAAVASRVRQGYGEAAARVAQDMRARHPDCSLASIVREIRSQKVAGTLSDARLPANDRTIEVQLRRMGF